MVLERSLQALGRQAATPVVRDHRLELGDEAVLDLADVRLLRGGRHDDRAATVDDAVDRRAAVDRVAEAVTVRVRVAGAVGREDDVVGHHRGDVPAVVGARVHRAELHRGAGVDRRQGQGVVAGLQAVVQVHVERDRVLALHLVAQAVDDLALEGRDLDLHDGGRVGARALRDGDDGELGLDGLSGRCRQTHSSKEECCGHEAATDPTHVESPYLRRSGV